MKRNLKNAVVGLAGFALVLAVVGLAVAVTDTPSDVSDLSKWDNTGGAPAVNNAVLLGAGGSISTTLQQVQPLGTYRFSIQTGGEISSGGNIDQVTDITQFGYFVKLTMDPVYGPVDDAGTDTAPAIRAQSNGLIRLSATVVYHEASAETVLPTNYVLRVKLFDPELSQVNTGGQTDTPSQTPSVTTTPTITETPTPSVTPSPSGTPVPTSGPDEPGGPVEKPTPVAVNLYLKILPSRLIVDDLLAKSSGILGDGPSAEVVAVALDSEGKVDTRGTMAVKISDMDAGFGQLVSAPVDVSKGDPQYLGLYLPPSSSNFKNRTVHIEASYEVVGREPLHADAIVEVVRITNVRDRDNTLTVKAGTRNLYLQVLSR